MKQSIDQQNENLVLSLLMEKRQQDRLKLENALDRYKATGNDHHIESAIQNELNELTSFFFEFRDNSGNIMDYNDEIHDMQSLLANAEVHRQNRKYEESICVIKESKAKWQKINNLRTIIDRFEQAQSLFQEFQSKFDCYCFSEFPSLKALAHLFAQAQQFIKDGKEYKSSLYIDIIWSELQLMSTQEKNDIKSKKILNRISLINEKLSLLQETGETFRLDIYNQVLQNINGLININLIQTAERFLDEFEIQVNDQLMYSNCLSMILKCNENNQVNECVCKNEYWKASETLMVDKINQNISRLKSIRMSI